ncbi:hypothetical protein V5F77_05495 [Xanthobacter sp. DSM 24535]|uniref:hypothetical protein n=1 Tax=Roseixanthobacter psychrophilus TaxID=3119917 RepID=UPI00372BD0DE
MIRSALANFRALILGLALVAAAGAAQAQTQMQVLVPMGSGGAPPDFNAYPLRDRLFGPGGAVFPDYVNPPTEGAPAGSPPAYVIGSGPGILFAAGTADLLCQPAGRPQIQVVRAPAGAKLSVAPGAFAVTGTDAGSTLCYGKPMVGNVVRLSGKGPRSGGAVVLRVTYPPLGAWYDHQVNLPAR